MIKWALIRAGLDAAALAERFPKLSEWESGDVKPTMRQLEDFASVTMAPLGYFFLAEPPEERLPVPDFRTVKDSLPKRLSPNLLETIYTMQRRQLWLREYRTEQRAAPLPFIRSTTTRADPAVVANTIRRALGLVTGWADVLGSWTDALRSFRERVEELGVVVVFNGVVGNNVYRKLEPEEFRGFVLVDEFAPLIFVNGADAKAAQMFTLAHEVAHLWIGQDGVFNLPMMQPAADDSELFCNRVAAEILIPSTELGAVWPDAQKTAAPYGYLARRFKVSEIVAARRALDLSLISRSAFFKFYNDYIARELQRPKSSGGDFYATQNSRVGRVFGEAVGRAVASGRLLYRDAFALTGLSGATFEKYIKTLGVAQG
jgi:Zn-dependent peptidase ImmA (M78 family)